jgi:hypothetical protein
LLIRLQMIKKYKIYDKINYALPYTPLHLKINKLKNNSIGIPLFQILESLASNLCCVLIIWSRHSMAVNILPLDNLTKQHTPFDRK